MGDRKTWAIVLGSAVGVALVAVAATWYMKTRDHGEPIMRDVQGMISDAYDKIRDLEQALANWRSPEAA